MSDRTPQALSHQARNAPHAPQQPARGVATVPEIADILARIRRSECGWCGRRLSGRQERGCSGRHRFRIWKALNPNQPVQLTLSVPVSEAFQAAVHGAICAVLDRQGRVAASDVEPLVPEKLHPAQPNHWGIVFGALRRTMGLRRDGFQRSPRPDRKGGVESVWRMP